MATTSSDTGGLPSGVVDDLLSEEHRRLALSILADRGEPVVVESLATAVLAAREDCPESDVPAEKREAMAEELYTDHIPKLTATGVVTYDSMKGAVELARPGIVER
jgi:hypothetical protein